jgi:hypothetical protein
MFDENWEGVREAGNVENGRRIDRDKRPNVLNGAERLNG